jgi:hypothetical protein
MLIGHFKSIVPQLLERIAGPALHRAAPYVFVADINTTIEPGKFDIYPIRILGYRIKKTAVFEDPGIHGIFESIGKARLIKRLILMRGEVDLEITPLFGSIDAITRAKKKTYYGKAKKGHQSLIFRVAAL